MSIPARGYGNDRFFFLHTTENWVLGEGQNSSYHSLHITSLWSKSAMGD